jgi:acyl-CoA thioester hydrolase
MGELFAVPITVRRYELDTQGHLNQAVYLQYAEHARWEFLLSAGISQDVLLDSGVGPVVLETTIRYERELRGGEEVTVSCAFDWTGGKTFLLVQEIRTLDGAPAARISSRCGLLDLRERRLVADPAQRLRALTSTPALLA